MVTGWSGGLEIGPESSVLLEGAVLHRCVHQSQDFSGCVSFAVY